MDEKKTFEYGELTAPLDLSRYDVAERWEAAFEQCGLAVKEAARLSKSSQQIRAVVEAVGRLYDGVFDSPDASKRALGEMKSVEDALKAMTALTDFAASQSKETAENIQFLTEKYKPNRETRRAAGQQ